MATLRAEVHGPIRIINTGENVFGGKVTVVASGAGAFATFVNLSSKVMRTTSRVVYSAANSTGGLWVGRDPNTRGILIGPHATLQGKMRVDYNAAGAETATFTFLIFDGGTNVSV